MASKIWNPILCVTSNSALEFLGILLEHCMACPNTGKIQNWLEVARETCRAIYSCLCQYPQDKIMSAFVPIITVIFSSEIRIYVSLPYMSHGVPTNLNISNQFISILSFRWFIFWIKWKSMYSLCKLTKYTLGLRSNMKTCHFINKNYYILEKSLFRFSYPISPWTKVKVKCSINQFMAVPQCSI